jgi:proteasome assembly chaperone (PAC2) family protein
MASASGWNPRGGEGLLSEVVTDLGIDRPILLQGLVGFMDAGGASRIATKYLLETLESEVVARVDIDRVFDYRARRPKALFLSDHFESMELPELVVRQFVDDANEPFLMLAGPEPDFGWQAVVGSILGLVEMWEVKLTVGMIGVPFPAPHTRPVQVTAYGTSDALLTGRRPWVGDLEVPGSLSSMLELAMGERDMDAMTLMAHVPHYLVGAEYDRAAVRLLEEVSAVTGLVLPLDDLRERADVTDSEIALQVSTDPDSNEVVRTLETQFDAFMAARGQEGAQEMTNAVSDLPTGDEIAEQVERFLADLGRDTRD